MAMGTARPAGAISREASEAPSSEPTEADYESDTSLVQVHTSGLKTS